MTPVQAEGSIPLAIILPLGACSCACLVPSKLAELHRLQQIQHGKCARPSYNHNLNYENGRDFRPAQQDPAARGLLSRRQLGPSAAGSQSFPDSPPPLSN